MGDLLARLDHCSLLASTDRPREALEILTRETDGKEAPQGGQTDGGALDPDIASAALLRVKLAFQIGELQRVREELTVGGLLPAPAPGGLGKVSKVGVEQ